MDQNQFDGLIRYSLRHRRSPFWGSFIQGLRRNFYGPEYGGPEWHEGWLALGENCKIEKAGYLAGLNFKQWEDISPLEKILKGRETMRTRRSWRNQDRLYRDLGGKENKPIKPKLTSCCFNCVSYGESKRNRNECTLKGEMVYGLTFNLPCFGEA